MKSFVLPQSEKGFHIKSWPIIRAEMGGKPQLTQLSYMKTSSVAKHHLSVRSQGEECLISATVTSQKQSTFQTTSDTKLHDSQISNGGYGRKVVDLGNNDKSQHPQ